MGAGAWLGVAAAALVLGSVLATLVQAIRDVSRTRLEELALRRGGEAARQKIADLVDHQEGYATSMALPRTACSLVVGVALVMWVTVTRGLTAPTLLELGLGLALASMLLWIFVSMVPISIARYAAAGTVLAWAPLMRATYLVGRPFAALAAGLDEIIRRLSGREDKAAATQKDILEAVEEAKFEGAMDDREQEMIEAVVTLRDKTVAQVMTPRTEIEAMELSNDLSTVTATIRSIGHSRIPVYEANLDRIAGVFYVKDLMKWLAGEGSRTGKPFNLKALLRPAIFVPETKTVRELLPELLSKRVHIALVADEYGGTSGLVTIEDIIEEVFGDIQDEYENVEDQQTGVKIDTARRSAEIDARAYISDVNDALLPLGLELPASEDYDTVGGFVTVTLGRIPGAGEAFHHDGMEIRVLEAEPTRVMKVEVLGGTSTPAEVAPPAAERA
ncbi:MAG: hemolysin family protein [Phycisphaerales bacterium]